MSPDSTTIAKAMKQSALIIMHLAWFKPGELSSCLDGKRVTVR